VPEGDHRGVNKPCSLKRLFGGEVGGGSRLTRGSLHTTVMERRRTIYSAVDELHEKRRRTQSKAGTILDKEEPNLERAKMWKNVFLSPAMRIRRMTPAGEGYL